MGSGRSLVQAEKLKIVWDIHMANKTKDFW